MSTQVTQYAMWGIVLPGDWIDQFQGGDPGDTISSPGDKFYEHYEPFILHHAFRDKIEHHEGIMCLVDGRDGRYTIIGRVLEKKIEPHLIGERAPFRFSQLTDIEKEFIQISVKKHFDLDGPFEYVMVTHLS